MRIGQGYDIHRLAPGRKLCLGGVIIPNDRGEEGHSDGDVLIHAVIDALLGALALGDIGSHFPPGSPEYRDIDSRILLKKTMELIESRNARIINLDTTVILENPRLAPHVKSICESLSALCGLDINAVSVKAKTKEGRDATGRGEAVEACAVVLIEEGG
ncbi:MAG: 2-C-methyl-D-erythritol 2,4-cyclodiphosphate synthase [Spirochaetales bacterium]|nr:2-C-methyl-D-erythritol 2,4-cyclodiphosphate synthase [Spirochaetales bacterium]